MVFPRSIDRGLIEARNRRILPDDTAHNFRDQLIAASLKHKGNLFQMAPGMKFPRSIDRGLIEARVREIAMRQL